MSCKSTSVVTSLCRTGSELNSDIVLFSLVFRSVFHGVGGPGGGFGAPGGGFSDSRSSGKPLLLLRLKNHPQDHENHHQDHQNHHQEPPYVQNYDPTTIIPIFRIVVTFFVFLDITRRHGDL